MLSTDEPLSLLVEKLGELERADRVAILSRLAPHERAQIARLSSRVRDASADDSSFHLSQLIADERSALTPQAREALRRAMRTALIPIADRTVPRGSSLAEAAGALIRRGRRR